MKLFSPAQARALDTLGRWSVRIVMLVGLIALAVALVSHFDFVVRLFVTVLALAMIGAIGVIRG